MLDELVKVALVGTGRDSSPPPAAGEPLDAALEAVKSGSAEARLLGAAAIASAYERCGCTPIAAEHRPQAATTDTLSPCSPHAGQILSMLLADGGAHKAPLVAEWLGHAVRAHRRAPHRLLPKLLDYAASRRDVREQVAHVADARGQWLARQNPAWQFGVAPTGDAAADWETGTGDQRLAALRALRERDPGRAADLLRATWDQDAADDRAAFVEQFATRLSAADEPLLEFALDDKSKRVRAAAAELLARLPESAFVRRMTGRAVALIKYAPPKGRAKQGVIEVTLPAEPFDESLTRDGIVEKPTEQIGRRQWWLLQILSLVPVGAWTKAWGVTPEECIAATAGEFKDVLVRGWLASATRLADVPWIKAILLATLSKDLRYDTLAALRALDVAGQEAVIGELLTADGTTFETLTQILHLTTAPLSGPAADAAIERTEAYVASRPASYDYALPGVLDQLSLRLPVNVYDRLVERWTGDRWEANRKSLDSFFHTLGLRRDMKREFTP